MLRTRRNAPNTAPAQSSAPSPSPPRAPNRAVSDAEERKEEAPAAATPSRRAANEPKFLTESRNLLAMIRSGASFDVTDDHQTALEQLIKKYTQELDKGVKKEQQITQLTKRLCNRLASVAVSFPSFPKHSLPLHFTPLHHF